MQTQYEKRLGAIERLEDAKWENSKRFRKDSSEESKKAWIRYRDEHIAHLKSLR